MTGAFLALCDASSPSASQEAADLAVRLAAEAHLPAHVAFTGATAWEDRGWAKVWRVETQDGRGMATVLTRLMESNDWVGIVAGDTPLCRETLGRLAGRLGLPLAGRVLSAAIAGDHLEVVRAVDQGRRSAKYRLAQLPALLLVDPDAPSTPRSPAPGFVEGETIRAESTAFPRETAERSLGPFEIAPQEADTVVAGGAGLGEQGFRLAEELAELLHGAVGASRVAVDLGWAPRSCQVGMTGQVVQPHLYIGAGISGAIHHTFGMKDAGFIVAINSDPAAPIFQLADVAVVGDAREIIAALIEALKTRSSGGESRRPALAGSLA